MGRAFRSLLFALGVLTSTMANAASSAYAEASSIPYGDGGYIPDFIAIIRRHNESGEPFRIQGVCKSACTMFLGIRNVCVERSATLMFHAGHDIAENITGPDTRATRALVRRYNAALRRYLLDGHHLDTDAYHSISGDIIIDRFGYRECDK